MEYEIPAAAIGECLAEHRLSRNNPSLIEPFAYAGFDPSG
jgi:hypothetical protein